MKLLVIYAHPVPTSFCAAVLATATEALNRAGHTLRVVDLYAENFQPILTCEEREAYLDNTEMLIERERVHVDNLHWAEGLVFVFPTWYYGPPAMLKGWLERVWLPGVTFEVASKKGSKTTSKISHIKRLVVVTTSGSPRWWLTLIGNPCKRLFLRGLRILFNRRCKSTWLQLHEMNVVSQEERERFLARVERKLAKI